MASFSLDCAEKFLAKVSEDLESSKILFERNVNSSAIYHLHQANEKMYKAIRCLLDYLFTSIPLKLIRIMHKCIEFNSNEIENMFIKLEKKLEQQELKDPKKLDKLFKKIYSHDVAEGFFKEIDDIKKSYEITTEYIADSIKHCMPEFSRIIKDIFKNIEDRLFQSSKNAIQQYLSNTQSVNIETIYSMYATEYLLIKDDIIEELIKILNEYEITTNVKEPIKKAWKFVFTIFTVLIINIYMNKLSDVRYPDFVNSESQNTLYNEIKSNLSVLSNINLRNYHRVRTTLNLLQDVEQKFQTYQCDERISYDEFKNQLEKTATYIIQSILRINSHW